MPFSWIFCSFLEFGGFESLGSTQSSPERGGVQEESDVVQEGKLHNLACCVLSFLSSFDILTCMSHLSALGDFFICAVALALPFLGFVLVRTSLLGKGTVLQTTTLRESCCLFHRV